jgi:methyl-accepting chemotaxis protein
MKLGQKILALTVSGTLTTSLLLVGLVYFRQGTLEATVMSDIDTKARIQCQFIAEQLADVMTIIDEMSARQVGSGIDALSRDVNDQGVTFSTETVTWKAVNQETKVEEEIALPKMLVGGMWLEQNRDMNLPSMFDAKMRDVEGGLVTIFQRINDRGDMLRVSTNVPDKSGNRAIGSFIPATDSEGLPNPVVAALLRGERYVGRALVYDKWCVTAYDPIFDNDKKLVGAAFCGIPQKAFQSIRDVIMNTTVGQTGYVYVIQGKGKDRGNYIISYKGQRDGENIWNVKDANGNFAIQNIVQTALAAPAGESAIVEYPWINQGETVARDKVAAVAYYAPWDWVIGVSAYKDDFRAAAITINRELNLLMTVCTVAGIAVTVGLATLAVYASRKITQPLVAVSYSLKEIAQGDGDLRRRLDDTSKDETGELAHWFNVFVEKIQTVMARVAVTASELGTASTDMFGTAQELAQSAEKATDQSASVAAAAEEVSTTMVGMTQTSQEMAQSIDSAAAAVEEMTASISGIATNAASAADVAEKAAQMVETSNSTIGRLSDAANEIGNVVQLIQEIAEQTNLLALNATIEAARAGESGKGFAVVATEVKELARQTQQATENIRNRIEGIQSSSNETVGAMGSIRETIDQVKQVSRTIAAAVHEQSEATQEIAKNVTLTSTAASSFSHGLYGSTDASREIARSITNVDQEARHTLSAAKHAKQTGDDLAKLAREMQELVGRFNA